MGLLFMTGSPLQREGPFPLFQDAERGNRDSPKARAGGEIDAQNRYLRENLDVMSKRLGELQAKMVQLDAVNKRVVGYS